MTQEVDVSQIIETTAQKIYDLIQAKKNRKKIKKKARKIIEKARVLEEASKWFVRQQNIYLDLKKLIDRITKEINNLKKDMKKSDIDKNTIETDIKRKENAQKLFLGMQQNTKYYVDSLYKKEVGNTYKQALLDLQLASYDLQKTFADLQDKVFVIDYVVYNRGSPIIYRFSYDQFKKMISFDDSSLLTGLLSKINFSKKQLEEMIKVDKIVIQKIENSSDKINLSIISEHANQIQHIYSIAYERYEEEPKKAIDIKLAQKSERAHKILRFLINNKGDLAEGYVRFLYVLNNFNDINLNIQGEKYEEADIFWINEKEKSKEHDEMHLFDFLVRGVVSVTNQSGFFIEDVTTLTEEGKILESAVKFRNANPLGLTQVIQLSKQILSLLDNKINKQDFINYLNNDTRFFKGARRNGLKNELQNEIKKGAKLTAEEDIYKYLKTIIKS